MNIYSRLLKLYGTNGVKTPLEDFCTEILAGIFINDPAIGDAFVNELLQIEGTGFTFRTQEHFHSTNPLHSDCRVDLVIRSEDTICFVEHKVESREGYIQLERYAAVLAAFRPELNTHLKYCTKYYDQKSISTHNFEQFRWADVCRFLNRWKSSGMVHQFLDFLNEHDMSDNMEFTLGDLTALQGISPVIKKMDRYLEKIRAVFRLYFDDRLVKDSENLHQIKTHSRYIFHLAYVFGDTDYSELGAGFDFVEAEAPQLKVWLWTNDKNGKAKEFKAAIQGHKFLTNGENWLGLIKPMSDFMSSSDMEKDIEKWFASAFESLLTFAQNHPELDWHILKKEI
ncbi:PD-(D/E)XK nuclease family protein [Mucilaginibacter sp. AK015]|uniref:PD-(D/E)XK nuclease family protein n=1 Tax=Mucilaginibacter sp. AK015 TaxID=2723072 RepID=UPI001609578A|nr:PD-(D/E)XK nuclease family protein [Mucilaginibacter sp. AK015]MBB5395062.1 hypothetical protein [Mucilaginibacter sp. AK015]